MEEWASLTRLVNIMDKDRKLDLIKRLNKILVKDGINPISEDSISKFIIDNKREQTHLKAKELAEKREQRNKIHSNLKKEYGIDFNGVKSFNRVIFTYMDPTDSLDAKERNVETIKNLCTFEGSSKALSDTMKEMMNQDFSMFYSASGSISKLVEAYENKGDLLECAMASFDGVGQNSMYSPKIKAITEKKQLLVGGAGRYAIDIASNDLYNYLPDDTFDGEKLLCIDSHLDEIVEDFPELSGVFTHENFRPTMTPGATYKTNVNVAKAIASGKIPDVKSCLMEYHFEKDDKKVPFSEIYEKLAQGQSIDEYTAVKNSPEEIKTTKDALESNELLFGTREQMTKGLNLDKSFELKSKIGLDIANNINYALKLTGSEAISVDEVEKTIKDKSRQALRKKAIEIQQIEVKQNEILTSIQQNLGIQAPSSATARLIATYIDLSGTEEARKKNEDLVKSTSTEEGLIELENKAIKEILSIDPKDIYSKDTSLESLIEHSKENNARNRRCWAIVNVLEDRKVDYRIEDALKTNINFLTNNASENAVSLVSSQLYSMLPDRVLNDQKMMNTVFTQLPDISKKYEDMSVEFTQENLSKTIANAINVKDQRDNTFCRDMVMEGKFDLTKGEFKLEGKEKTTITDLSQAKKDGRGNDIKFVEFSDNKKRDINQALKENFVYSKAQQRKNLESAFSKFISEDGKNLDIKTSFAKTHSIFSRDSKQFKEMEASLAKFSKMVIDYNNLKKPSLDTMSEKARQIREALYDLKDKTTTYRDKKQNEKATQKKFSSRSQERLEWANQLLAVTDTVLGPEPIKTQENPYRRPLTMDRVEKLMKDVEEKSVVVDKQKIKDAPTKEVSLNRGTK